MTLMFTSHGDVDGSIHCCGCWLEPMQKRNPDSRNAGRGLSRHEAALVTLRCNPHVTEHLKAGHRVPDYVTERLAKELLERGDDTAK